VSTVIALGLVDEEFMGAKVEVIRLLWACVDIKNYAHVSCTTKREAGRERFSIKIKIKTRLYRQADYQSIQKKKGTIAIGTPRREIQLPFRHQ
jgi:hypothetical protein